MDLDLSGRHALVCGASEGIGRAAARELALLGADVTVLARREAVLREVVAALPRTHARQHHRFVEADLTRHAELAGDIAALAATRPVHILVNNAGGPPPGRVIDAEPGININGDAFLLRQAVLNLLDNAIEFSPDGGEISLILRSTAETQAIAVSVASAGRQTSRFGMMRIDGMCSTGWWVGPSSPRPMESWV